MSLLNRKSNLDLVGQFAAPEIEDSLTFQTLNPNGVQQDEMVGHLNNMTVPPFHNGPEPLGDIRNTLHENSLESIHMSQTNPGATYGAGQPGSTWPSLSPTGLDLNGNTPPKYEDNMPE